MNLLYFCKSLSSGRWQNLEILQNPVLEVWLREVIKLLEGSCGKEANNPGNSLKHTKTRSRSDAPPKRHLPEDLSLPQRETFSPFPRFEPPTSCSPHPAHLAAAAGALGRAVAVAGRRWWLLAWTSPLNRPVNTELLVRQDYRRGLD